MLLKYRKLIVAAIALVLLAGKDLLGLDFGATPDAIFETVVMIGGAAGVWAVPNA